MGKKSKVDKIEERDALIVRLMEYLDPHTYTDHNELVIECLRVMGYGDNDIHLYLAGELVLPGQ
jgi:hypothetical protein